MLKIVYGEVRGLHQAAYVLGLFAFGSQLLALVRDRLLASQFGAGIELDLYYTAFRIPDLMYVLFASMLSVYVLLPLVAVRQHEDGAGARALLSQVFSAFLVLYSVLALVMYISAPFVLPVLFPGLAADMTELVTLTRILLLQPLFLGVSSLFGVVTQLGHRFVLYAISPLIYNVGIIAGIAFGYPVFGLTGLVLGVVLGAFGHMAVQWPLVRGSAFAFTTTYRIAWSTISQVLRVSVPRAATLAMHQIVLVVVVSIAGTMTVGSVAVWQFAYNLQAVPLAIIGASYSIAAFPMLADLYAKSDLVRFRSHIIAAIRHIIFWSIPIIALTIVLRAHMVRVVLGSGEFDWSDTKLTAAVLALLVVSLASQALYLLIVRAFYAAGVTSIPFIVTAVSSTVVAAGALFTTHPIVGTSFLPIMASWFRVGDVPGSEILLLAFVYSLVVSIQAIVLLWWSKKYFTLDMSWCTTHTLKSCTAAFVGAVTAYGMLNFVVAGINQDTFVGIFIQGLLGGIAGVIGVIFTYYVLRSPEMSEVYRAVRSRLFRTDIVAPQEDLL